MPGHEIDISQVLSFAKYCETLEKAKLIHRSAVSWKTRILTDTPPALYARRVFDFNTLYQYLAGRATVERAPLISAEETEGLFSALLDSFDLAYSLQEPDDLYLTYTIINGVKRIGIESHDPGQVKLINKMLNEAKNIHPEAFTIFTANVLAYAVHHRLDDTAVSGLTQKFYPDLAHTLQAEPGTSPLEVFRKPGNIFTVESDNFGIGDFMIYCYVLGVTPANINRLIRVQKDLPTTDVARLEQNRLDGLSLMNAFGIIRDYIHDQRPHVHELISAMVDYYESGNVNVLAKVAERTDSNYFDTRRRNMLFDRTNYEVEVTATIREKKQTQKAIEVLKRLQKNTEPVKPEPPVTENSILNGKITMAQENKRYPALHRQAIAEAMEVISSELIKMTTNHEIGVQPAMVLAATWLEQQGFRVLQAISFEDQMAAYRQDWFISFIKFHELIASTQFDAVEFDDFARKLRECPNETDAYQMLGNRVVEQTYQLARQYRKDGLEDTGFLWSGNMTDELMGLTEPRTAKTALGKRIAGERVKRRFQEGFHPGD